MIAEERGVAAAGNQAGGHVALVEQVELDVLVATDHLHVIVPVPVSQSGFYFISIIILIINY